jgi:hypothetical protein
MEEHDDLPDSTEPASTEPADDLPRGALILARWPRTREEVDAFYAALQEEYAAMLERRAARAARRGRG